MKAGVIIFPGSNCDRDMQDALQYDLNQEVIMLWHKDTDLSGFSQEDCIVLPGGFSYGDYLRCGAIARFSPIMQSITEFAGKQMKNLYDLTYTLRELKPGDKVTVKYLRDGKLRQAEVTLKRK